ncbi:hypothetical protein C0J50_7857 [Silurus asotus]|uniref:Uncharacterized protein n=1 Tax=Silurus asotus TaxID=30991 RepID=A0AAD5B6Z3_SILAS|nr:hypothetical protein C0J50_7857 [Silurus asotus]
MAAVNWLLNAAVQFTRVFGKRTFTELSTEPAAGAAATFKISGLKHVAELLFQSTVLDVFIETFPIFNLKGFNKQEVEKLGRDTETWWFTLTLELGDINPGDVTVAEKRPNLTEVTRIIKNTNVNMHTNERVPACQPNWGPP